LQPLRAICNSGEELFQPALLDYPVVGSGPETKFLTVIAIEGHGPSGLFHFPEMAHDLLYWLKRNEVAHDHGRGQQAQSLPFFFRDVAAVDIVWFEAGIIEMRVINHSVSHSCAGQRQRQTRIPNTFGQPEAGRFTIKAAFDVFVHHPHLAPGIPDRNAGQQGFEKPAR